MKPVITTLVLTLTCSFALAQEEGSPPKTGGTQIQGNTNIKAKPCGPGSHWVVINGKGTCEMYWATKKREDAAKAEPDKSKAVSNN
jgi:hypothetical protein